MRKSKAFGLVLAATLALSAVGASAAFATYDSEVETTTTSGVQVVENTFTTDVGNTKCKTMTVSGTQKGKEVDKGIFTAATGKDTPDLRNLQPGGSKRRNYYHRL